MGNKHFRPSAADTLEDSDSSSKNTPNSPVLPVVAQQATSNPMNAVQSQQQDCWCCDVCTFLNGTKLMYCKMCNAAKPTNTVWCCQNDKAEYEAYAANVCNNINKLVIGDVYTVTIANTRYEIKRISHDQCIQTNLHNHDIKLVVPQESVQHSKQQDASPAATTHSHGHSSPHSHGTSNQSQQQQWYWQDNDKSYKPFQNKTSKELDKLNIGDIHIMYIHGTKYEVTKIAADECTQMNTKTHFQRKVVPKSKANAKQTGHAFDDDSKQDLDYEHHHHHHGGKDSNQAMWVWEDNNGSYKPYSADVSQTLDKLSIGDTYSTRFGNSTYLITKIAHDKAEQKNASTNFVRNAVRKSGGSTHHHPSGRRSNHFHKRGEHGDDEKRETPKWYYKDDDGQFKQCGYNVSKTLSNLAINENKKLCIHQKWYEFKKTDTHKCEQKNTKTGKVRECRLAKYGWSYKTNDQKWVPYTDGAVNKKLNAAAVGDTVTFSVKSNKYSVTKKSMNNAEQTNLSSNTKREVVRKMILNEEDETAHGSYGAIIDKKKVRELFHATLNKSSYDIKEIKDVSKSTNFMVQESIIQEKCKKRGKKRSEIEKYLWHGTKDLKNLDLIINNGFDRSFNSTSLYGKGTYFARDAKYSANGYCGADSNGVFHILLCRVIVGEYTKGNSSIKTIPRKSDGTEYDTLVDKTGDPSIFVVWRDYHAVPCYLVKYKKG